MIRQGRLWTWVALLELLSKRQTCAFHHGAGGAPLMIAGGTLGHRRYYAFLSRRSSTAAKAHHVKDLRAGRRRYLSSSSTALFQISKPEDDDNDKNNSGRGGGGGGGAYSDDCFGLVSLFGGFATMDVVFVPIFVTVSAMAATLTRMALLPANKRVPGVVAALTFVLTLVVSNIVDSNVLSAALTEVLGYAPSMSADINPDATLIELALCSFSIAYSLTGSKDV
jgi:hypothetical protein